jgi:hypothetical protein
VMVTLAQRGFAVIQESDPVILRHRVEEARPFSPDHPVIMITTGALEDLPYDLYQPAYRISLSLHNYFPNLAYPVLQILSPDQVEKLGFCPQPDKALSRQKTIEYLLGEVFNADLPGLRQPPALIAWLNEYHRRNSPLPDLLRSNLVEGLRRWPAYQEWDLDLMIRDVQAFASFIQGQWQAFIEESLTGEQIKEFDSAYHVSFGHDSELQDLLPGLVYSGVIRPLEVEDLSGLPAWAQPGVTVVDVSHSSWRILTNG